jgi:undecaprenyl-diphosphatase
MNILQAIILGILQGLSEFLPISSTAHLTIAGDLFGLIDPNNPERWTAFIATVQLGTLAAVLIYFIRDIKSITIEFFLQNFSSGKLSYSNQSHNSKMGWFIIIGTIPIVILGFTLKKIIEGAITKELTVIAISLIVLALILALAERIANLKRDLNSVKWYESLIIGIAQCFALIPGASRSGTTITAGLFLGLKRDSAARFSFLLSIPAVFASGLYEFYKSLHYITAGDLISILIATIFAAISGYAAIAFLLNYLRTKSTMLFVYYRIALGLVILLFL